MLDRARARFAAHRRRRRGRARSRRSPARRIGGRSTRWCRPSRSTTCPTSASERCSPRSSVRSGPGACSSNLEHVASPTPELHEAFLYAIDSSPERDDPSNKLAVGRDPARVAARGGLHAGRLPLEVAGARPPRRREARLSRAICGGAGVPPVTREISESDFRNPGPVPKVMTASGGFSGAAGRLARLDPGPDVEGRDLGSQRVPDVPVRLSAHA